MFIFEFYKMGSLNTLLLSIYNVTCTITPLAPHNKHKNLNKCMEYKEHLRSDASDWREAWIAASSNSAAELTIGWVWGGVKNGTLFSSLGGNSTPAAC